MWIKICANTNVEDALLAAELGVDAVGFVFASSKRQVTADEVAEIARALPQGIERVGVFATGADCVAAADEALGIAQSVRHAGLTAAQLHGAFCAPLISTLLEECGPRLKIVQTMAYALDAADRADADARFEAALRLVFTEPKVWAVLLDAAKGGASGGLGVRFDWERVGKIVQRTRAAFGAGAPHIILAGGLRAENVAEGIAAIGPWGVDVASGVESLPGKKDPAKLKAFVESVRAAGRDGAGVRLFGVRVR